MKSRENILAGAGLMFVAQFFSASVVTAVKVVSGAVATSCVVFIGYSICFVIACIIVAKNKMSLKTQHIQLQLARGIVGVLYFGSLFVAVKYIPAADAILLRSASPIWTPLILFAIMGVGIDKYLISAILLGFVGIALVLHPTLVGINLGYFIGLLSGIFFAFSGIVTRELQKLNEPLLRTLFYSFMIPALALAPAAFIQWPDVITNKDTALLILIGLGTYGLLLLFVSAFRHASATVLMPLTYFGVVIAGFYDWLIWSMVPDLLSIVGLVIIFISCCYIVWLENKKNLSLA